MPNSAPIASIKVEGDTVTTTFSNGNVIAAAYSELPAEQARVAGVYGLAHFVRTAYSNSENVAEAVIDVQTRIDALRAGKWSPNSRSNVGTKEPDNLARAVMEALSITQDVYDNRFLPAWIAKHTTVTTTRDGETRQMGKTKAIKLLCEHPQVAPILAKHAAEHAKALRGTQGESLDGYAVATAPAEAQEAA